MGLAICSPTHGALRPSTFSYCVERFFGRRYFHQFQCSHSFALAQPEFAQEGQMPARIRGLRYVQHTFVINGRRSFQRNSGLRPAIVQPTQQLGNLGSDGGQRVTAPKDVRGASVMPSRAPNTTPMNPGTVPAHSTRGQRPWPSPSLEQNPSLAQFPFTSRQRSCL